MNALDNFYRKFHRRITAKYVQSFLTFCEDNKLSGDLCNYLWLYQNSIIIENDTMKIVDKDTLQSVSKQTLLSVVSYLKTIN